MIEKYKFGLIIVEGKTYNYDVEVRWTNQVLGWRREKSHIVDIEDVRRAVKENPDTIIIGTGEAGIAEVTESAQKFIQESGIKLIIDKTEEATKTFNVILEDSELEEGKQNKVVGLFHLTC